MAGNREALYLALQQVPPGRVITYGNLARLAGHSRGARWAGQVLAQLPQNSALPWHRVVNSQGKISLPGSRAARQRALLEAEGVEFQRDKIKLALYGWLAA